MTPKPAAIIQARMGSTRLPGKVLRTFAGRSALGWVLRAARLADRFETIVLATTTLPEDDVLARAGADLGMFVVRGPSQDVLARYVLAVERTGATALVRLTADCPLLDPGLIRMAVDAFSSGELDYVSTDLVPSLPRGFDVEVLLVSALHIADREAEGADRVHVTSFVYGHPERFVVAGLNVLPDAHELRVTLDTPEDAAVIDAIVDEFGDVPGDWRRIAAFLRRRPDIAALNAAVAQKALEQG